MAAKGMGLPSGSICASTSARRVSSRNRTLPWSKPILSMSMTQGDGSPLSGSVNTQLARPSFRRCRLAAGPVSWIWRIITRRASSGNGDRLNSARRSVAMCGSSAQSGLPMATSSMAMRGHGTQLRQPVSSAGRRHCTVSSPLMAKGRPIAADTRSLMVGFSWFQSNNATTSTRAATSTTRVPPSPISTFLVRVMAAVPLPGAPDAARPCYQGIGGNWNFYQRMCADFSKSAYSAAISGGTHEACPGLLAFGVMMAARAVVVDHAHRLHEGVHGGWADELPAELLQVFRQGQRLRRHGRRLRGARAGRRFVAPQVGAQRAVRGAHFLGAAGVVDHRLDLAAVAHDAGIGHQRLDPRRAVARHLVDVEIGESAAEPVALVQDGAPAQARLEAFQAQLLEQVAVVADRPAPLKVVVVPVALRMVHPGAARQAVLEIGAHGHAASSAINDTPMLLRRGRVSRVQRALRIVLGVGARRQRGQAQARPQPL